MKPPIVCLFVSLLPSVFAAGPETVVTPKIESVSAFKNGVIDPATK